MFITYVGIQFVNVPDEEGYVVRHGGELCPGVHISTVYGYPSFHSVLSRCSSSRSLRCTVS